MRQTSVAGADVEHPEARLVEQPGVAVHEVQLDRRVEAVAAHAPIPVEVVGETAERRILAQSGEERPRAPRRVLREDEVLEQRRTRQLAVRPHVRAVGAELRDAQLLGDEPRVPLRVNPRVYRECVVAIVERLERGVVLAQVLLVLGGGRWRDHGLTGAAPVEGGQRARRYHREALRLEPALGESV